jgi:hypothetical protein
MEEQTNQLLSNDVGSKQWWKAYKRATGGTMSQMGPLSDDQGNLIIGSQEKANLLNSFFASQTKIQPNSATLPRVNDVATNEIEPMIVLPEEVYGILQRLNPEKATGSDGIGNRILREAALPISQPLAELMNFCLSLSTFPSIWKKAQVVPLFKKGDPHLTTNYRPISLLPCLSKVFEKILFDHIFAHVKANNILIPNQSGFIPGDSTANQLLTVCHNLARHLDCGDEVVAVFLDLTKAFDRVWHDGLLRKLQSVGIRGHLHQLLRSYLGDRKQFVSVEGANSGLETLHAGVPQGSVLGPLLFLLYINDVTQDLNSTVFLFADDTSLFIPIPRDTDRAAAAQAMNIELERVHQWAKKWNVAIHPQKTVMMIFGNRKTPDTTTLPAVYLHTQRLEAVERHTHLGLTLSCDLTWTNHISHLERKCGKMLGLQSLCVQINCG